MRGFLASFVMLMRQIGAGKTAEGDEPEDPQPHVPRFFCCPCQKMWRFLDEIPSQLSSLFRSRASFPRSVDGRRPTEVSKFCTFSTRKHEGAREIPPSCPFARQSKAGIEIHLSWEEKEKEKAGEARTFSRLSLGTVVCTRTKSLLVASHKGKKV